jgi:predicted dehydrogenase
LVAQVVPSPFTLGVDATIQSLIADGYLGDLLAVEVRDARGFVDLDAPLHWRHDSDLSGLNVMSLGIWYEAIVRWVGEATRVMAMGACFARLRRDPESGRMRAVRIPDHLDVLAEMACGAQARLHLSTATGLAGPRQALLYGSQGTLRFVDGALYGGRRGDDELHEIAIPPEKRGGWRVEADFIAAVRGQAPVTHTTFEDGLKYMRFTEAVARSVATGQAIPL